MKRNKKLILLSSIAIPATTLLVVAISCSVNKYTEKDSEEQKVQYKQAYDKNGQRAYKLVDSLVMTNDKALVPDQKYYIATNDYLAIGSDQYAMLDYAKSPK
ncbi:5'-nucleotidase, C-terminal domain [Mycoplasmopsis maculosa]|uniref:5'-nucleotidase, C-terminal domain n=1 Tax=Mycoplasmopsis maculosa TaxID=114885 RepID=A0A449B3S4_9BACT|nr:5'-nucleotidase C-terminal domain-containing protein [Mycoplasmopsis maculosa]VEU75254.1 5'-nucleotidase, C-terminal domain [Mycoplasmopsis maculosa]